MAAAGSFDYDPAYEALKALRQRASRSDLIFVEGV
jgi:uncharacterized protein (DUF1330 family)